MLANNCKLGYVKIDGRLEFSLVSGKSRQIRQKERTSGMIIDFSITNFRSFQGQQLFSMNAEAGLKRLSGNFSEIEDGKLSILRSAAIFGPNASGKSNLLKGISALKWLTSRSRLAEENESIPAYEPFKLSSGDHGKPTEFDIEFVVPSGIRYQYSVTYTKMRVITERLYSFQTRKGSEVFTRKKGDTWKTIKFGGSYKGGSRRFPFFPNSTYLSRAGNDASAPESIREVVQYFREIIVLNAGMNILSTGFYETDDNLKLISDLIQLADTGVENITAEESSPEDIVFPENMPDRIRKMIIQQNSVSYKFWHQGQDGQLIKFDQEEMSDGTVKLFQILPLLIGALTAGIPIFVDELDGHLHTNIVSLIFELFNDPLANVENAQLIVTTHDTNLMDPAKLRRDQLWLVQKENGASTLTSLDAYDKDFVRPTSPFEDFYKDGRFGALPTLSYVKFRDSLNQIYSQQGRVKG